MTSRHLSRQMATYPSRLQHANGDRRPKSSADEGAGSPSVQQTEGQARLTAMKLEWVDERKRLTSAATIASSKEDNGAEKTLPPQAKRVLRRNSAVMKKKPPRYLPPIKEEVRKIGSRKVRESMKRLLEGIDRGRELMIAR